MTAVTSINCILIIFSLHIMQLGSILLVASGGVYLGIGVVNKIFGVVGYTFALAIFGTAVELLANHYLEDHCIYLQQRCKRLFSTSKPSLSHTDSFSIIQLCLHSYNTLISLPAEYCSKFVASSGSHCSNHRNCSHCRHGFC